MSKNFFIFLVDTNANGYIDFLEIVSNDGDWDGDIKNVRFEVDD